MNSKRILAEMEFASIISESFANTQTGAELLNKYKSFVMANESSCTLVNNFIREASMHRYDNGVNSTLERVSEYVNENKTSWALASACENINANGGSYNYINRNYAVKQVESLLEMEESDVVKYIKAGALKNVMFCEEFRNIVKQVYKDNPIIESTLDYTKITPISMTESVGDGVCFEVSGNLYKMSADKTIQEASWDEVSNTFKVITQLLESNMVTIDQHTVTVNTNLASYVISEAGIVQRCGKDATKYMTVNELRENNRLTIMATSTKHRNSTAHVLEAIALLCENYDNVVSMDNVAIYTTKHDKFLVIEGGDTIYATLLASSRTPKWTVNENAIDALSFIKAKTNTSISENYSEVLDNAIEAADLQERERIATEVKEQEQKSYRERVEVLTEKFKNDPVKLAVLSKIAQEIANAE